MIGLCPVLLSLALIGGAEGDQEAIRRAYRTMDAAEAAGDARALRRVYAARFRIASAGGGVFDASAALSRERRTGSNRHRVASSGRRQRTRVEQLRVRGSRATAWVRVTAEERLPYLGRRVLHRGSFAAIDAWVGRVGEWRIASRKMREDLVMKPIP